MERLILGFSAVWLIERLITSHQALKAYQKANSIEPGRADILYNIAKYFGWMISLQEAIQVYRQSLNIDPLILLVGLIVDLAS